METLVDSKISHMAQRRSDLKYAGDVVRAYVKAVYGGPYKMASKLPNAVPTSTFYAVTGGKRYDANDPNTAHVEMSLGWPLGTIELLSVQDYAGMADAGAPADLIRMAKRVAAALRKSAGERRARNRTA